MPAFAESYRFDKQNISFTGDGAYCYAYDYSKDGYPVVRNYRLHVHGDQLAFQSVRSIPVNTASRALFNADPPMLSLGSGYMDTNHVQLSLFNLQGAPTTMVSPRCRGAFKGFMLGNACGGVVTSEMIGMANLRTGKTWTCRRLCKRFNGADPQNIFTTADGQAVLLTIDSPDGYEYSPIDDMIAAIPFIGKSRVAFNQQQRCRRQGLYEAFLAPGKEHALFYLSGEYQGKKYQLYGARLLADGRTILTLARDGNKYALLRYRW